MSATELRTAAQHLRDLAEKATPGPWSAVTEHVGIDLRETGRGSFSYARLLVSLDDTDYDPEYAENVPEDIDPQEAMEADAAWIAAVHPEVGKALADWLDGIAETYEADPSDYCGGKGHDEIDVNPGDCGSWWCANVNRALAVARLLGNTR